MKKGTKAEIQNTQGEQRAIWGKHKSKQGRTTDVLAKDKGKAALYIC